MSSSATAESSRPCPPVVIGAVRRCSASKSSASKSSASKSQRPGIVARLVAVGLQLLFTRAGLDGIVSVVAASPNRDVPPYCRYDRHQNDESAAAGNALHRNS